MSQFAHGNPNINKQKVNVPFAGLTSHHLCDKIMLRQSLPIRNGVYIIINEAQQANRACRFRLWHYSLETHNPDPRHPQWQCCDLVLPKRFCQPTRSLLLHLLDPVPKKGKLSKIIAREQTYHCGAFKVVCQGRSWSSSCPCPRSNLIANLVHERGSLSLHLINQI